MLTTPRSTDVNFIASQAIARQQAQESLNAGADGETASDIDPEKADAMAALERQARAPVGFVAASAGPEGGDRPKPQDAEKAAAGNGVENDAEIDLDDDL
jgi:pre-mRNA-splicing factor SYF1